MPLSPLSQDKIDEIYKNIPFDSEEKREAFKAEVNACKTAIEGSPSMMKQLLHASAQVAHYITPLMREAQQGNAAKVMAMVSLGMNIHATNKKASGHENALMFAIRKPLVHIPITLGHLYVVSILTQAGARLDDARTKNAQTKKVENQPISHAEQAQSSVQQTAYDLALIRFQLISNKIYNAHARKNRPKPSPEELVILEEIIKLLRPQEVAETIIHTLPPLPERKPPIIPQTNVTIGTEGTGHTYLMLSQLKNNIAQSSNTVRLTPLHKRGMKQSGESTKRLKEDQKPQDNSNMFKLNS